MRAQPPILIANSGYHVGHQMSIRVAEEQGFFRDEGLREYEYEWRGLVPGPFERDTLDLVMAEHGVDIATAVKVESVLHQRARGADLFIVGGWRYTPRTQLYGGRNIQRMADLRGGKIAIREVGGLGHGFITSGLRAAGIDPNTEVEWVCESELAYGHGSNQVDMLRRGQVEAIIGHAPGSEHLLSEGFPLLLDAKLTYPGGRPGRVIVATGATVRERVDELAAFLRANIRAFWFIRDPSSFPYLRDLEERLRARTHNRDERNLRMITSPDRLEGWVMPIDGGVSRTALQRVIEEAVEAGELENPPAVDDVLRDAVVNAAYHDLLGRADVGAAHEKALAAASKHGF